MNTPTNTNTDTYIGETRRSTGDAGSYYLVRRESPTKWLVLSEPVNRRELKMPVSWHTTEAAARKAAEKLCESLYGPTTYTRKCRWGTLAIRANFAVASSRIEYRVDDGEWRSTPFEVADFRHRPAAAMAEINDWLAGQGGN